MSLTKNDYELAKKINFKSRKDAINTSIKSLKFNNKKELAIYLNNIVAKINTVEAHIEDEKHKLGAIKKQNSLQLKQELQTYKNSLQKNIVQQKLEQLQERQKTEIQLAKLTIFDVDELEQKLNELNIFFDSEKQKLESEISNSDEQNHVKQIKEKYSLELEQEYAIGKQNYLNKVRNLKEELLELKHQKSRMVVEYKSIKKNKIRLFRSEKKSANTEAKNAIRELKTRSIYINAFGDPVEDTNVNAAEVSTKFGIQFQEFYENLSVYFTYKFLGEYLRTDQFSSAENESFLKIETIYNIKDELLSTRDIDSVLSKSFESNGQTMLVRKLLKMSKIKSVIKMTISSLQIQSLEISHFRKNIINAIASKVGSIHYDLLYELQPSFDNELKKIEYAVRADHEEKIILKTIKTHLDQTQFSTANKDHVAINNEDFVRSFDQKLVDIKSEYNIEKTRIIKDYNLGNFSKSSRNNSLKLAKFNMRSQIKELKLSNPEKQYSATLSYFKLELNREIKKENKVMFSKIDDAQRRIPTKCVKGHKWYALAASILLPGLGQILNKQYIKGFLLLIVTGFIAGLVMPIVFGAITFKGEGIFGLFHLSPEINVDGDIFYLDARFRIIEAVVSWLLLLISVAIYIFIARDSYYTGLARENGSRPKNSRDLRTYMTNQGLPLLLSTPAFFIILLVVVTPLITTIMLGFTNYGRGNLPPGNSLDWVGWKNFKAIFTGGYAESFGYVSSWTLIWTTTITIGILILGSTLAIIIDNPRIKGKALFSTVFILPWAVPAFATILFFSSAFDNGGLINKFLGTTTNYKLSTNWTKSILIMIQLWLGHSYMFLLMLGVKKSISSDFYEAASIDGASKFMQTLKITAPIILAQIAPLLIGQIVFNFNNYGIIWMFNDGGPQPLKVYMGSPGSTDIIISLIFKLSTSGTNNRVALASAFTMFVSVFVVGVSAIGFLRTKSFREGGQ